MGKGRVSITRWQKLNKNHPATDKPIQELVIPYVACSVCGYKTVARTTASPTLMGWVVDAATFPEGLKCPICKNVKPKDG